MDSERQLRNEFRRALDEVLPPAPWLEAAVTDDLRKRRSPRLVHRSPGTQPSGKSLPRSAMQLAAAVLVLVLAAAAVVTFLGLRYKAPQSTPAGAVSIEAYQTMVKRGDGELIVARDDSCSTLQSTCPASGTPVLFALQRWLDDLNRSEPPARFAMIAAQLRRHLSANISEVNALIAAYQAQDQNVLGRARMLSGHQQGWLDEVTRSIGDSQKGSAAAYIASIQSAYQTFGGCAVCQSLSNQVDCADMQATSCEYDVNNAMATIGPEAALVRVAAPSSLAAQDARLQNDLAQADTSVLAMADAQLAGDQAGFNAGLQSLQQALLAINPDIAGILGA